MHSRHCGCTRLSTLLPIGINPLPFHQNNKPTAPKEEFILDPKTQLLLQLPWACGEGSQRSLLARSGSLNTLSDPKTSTLDPKFKTMYPRPHVQYP